MKPAREWLLSSAVWLVLGLAFLALAQEKPASKRYALLVGINDYEHHKLRKLDFAENDVAELARLLRAYGYEVVLLTGSSKEEALRPTKENIEKHLKVLAERCRRKADTLVVALAGHGLQFEGEKDCFYCPVDGPPVKDKVTSLVSLRWLYTELDSSLAGVKVMLVDACRNDPEGGRGRGIDADTASRPPQGTAALFSCSAGEKAFEHKDLKQGVFFYYVLEGLRGEAANRGGRVTFEGLSDYVREKVPVKVRELYAAANQSPNMKADLVGVPPVLLELSAQKPEPLVAPFSAAEARSSRRSWASYLGVKEVERNSLGMDLVLIPPGEFMMGSPEGEKGRTKNEVQHRVRLTKAFYLGATEVTVGQFRAFAEAAQYKTEAEADGYGGFGRDIKKGKYWENPKFNWRKPGFKQKEDHPVVNVSWNDAVKFCEWLSKKESVEYRLPTEAEWEFACRAGAQTAYHCGDDPEGLARIGILDPNRVAIWGPHGYVYTVPVGKYETNGFGLFDMHGNVWEWCHDWYGEYGGDGVDPMGQEKGSKRVRRGGSWLLSPLSCRSALRGLDLPTNWLSSLGFRAARGKFSDKPLFKLKDKPK